MPNEKQTAAAWSSSLSVLHVCGCYVITSLLVFNRRAVNALTELHINA